MDNPNIAKCNQRFISVPNTQSSIRIYNVNLVKTGNACNKWNEVDKSDKIKCDLEVDGLPYCTSDILYGPGLNAVSGINVLGKSTTQKALHKANLIAKIKDLIKVNVNVKTVKVLKAITYKITYRSNYTFISMVLWMNILLNKLYSSYINV